MTRIARLCLVTLALVFGSAPLASCQSPVHRDAAAPTLRDRGELLYQHHCSGCHAVRGTGDAFLGVPALAGQRLAYLQRQVERFSNDQRHSSRMQWAFKRVSMHDSDAPLAVATYLSSLPVQRYAGSDARSVTEGETIYARQCAACHGADARGAVIGAVPSLRAQHDSYLVNRLRAFAGAAGSAGVDAHVTGEVQLTAVAAYLSSLKGLALDADLPFER